MTKQFIMTYRDGITSLPVFNVVEVPDSMIYRDVVVACQKYCRNRNFRYMSIRPFIIKLDELAEVIDESRISISPQTTSNGVIESAIQIESTTEIHGIEK